MAALVAGIHLLSGVRLQVFAVVADVLVHCFSLLVDEVGIPFRQNRQSRLRFGVLDERKGAIGFHVQPLHMPQMMITQLHQYI